MSETNDILSWFGEAYGRSMKSQSTLGVCNCWACIAERNEIAVLFVTCKTCGNKRCPKANDHRHECSGSNEPGQKGSAYEGAWRNP